MAQPFSSSGSIAELPTRQFHNRSARKRVCDTDTKLIARELHIGTGSSLITSASPYSVNGSGNFRYSRRSSSPLRAAALVYNFRPATV